MSPLLLFFILSLPAFILFSRILFRSPDHAWEDFAKDIRKQGGDPKKPDNWEVINKKHTRGFIVFLLLLYSSLFVFVMVYWLMFI